MVLGWNWFGVFVLILGDKFSSIEKRLLLQDFVLLSLDLLRSWEQLKNCPWWFDVAVCCSCFLLVTFQDTQEFQWLG